MKKIQSALLFAGSAINAKTIGLMSACGVAALPVMSVFAAEPTAPTGDLFSGATTLLGIIYRGVFSISTLLAVVIAVIALLFMMFSSNPRTVETSKSWLKRILIAWIIINALGLIIVTLQSWLSSAGAGDAGYLFNGDSTSSGGK